MLAGMANAALPISTRRREIEVVYSEGGSFIGRYGNVLVGASTGQNSYEGLDASLQLHRRMRTEFPNGFAKIVITAGGARMPSADERTRINRLAGEFARNTLAVALIFEGDGLWLSSMRMVTKAMMLAISREFPQSIFATVPEGVQWLTQQCGCSAEFEPRALIEAIAAQR